VDDLWRETTEIAFFLAKAADETACVTDTVASKAAKLTEPTAKQPTRSNNVTYTKFDITALITQLVLASKHPVLGERVNHPVFGKNG